MRIRVPAILRRFTRERDGVMIIEFGFLFPIVIAAMLGVIYLGIYLFSVQRTENVLNDVANSIMRMENPTLAEVQTALKGRLETAALPSGAGRATISTREDGIRVANVTIEISMLEKTPIFNTKGFNHASVLSIPLLDR